MKILLLRHGMTEGNLKKCYIGKTEESLIEEGRNILLTKQNKKEYPEIQLLFSSPKIRCLETAKILYPHLEPNIIKELQECDFGLWEGKNAIQLTGDRKYQTWIDSNGKLPFPEGEGIEEFKERCIRGFYQALEVCKNLEIIEKPQITIGMIVHGGSIMAILEKLGYPKQDYYDWKVKNGGGYLGEYRQERKRIEIIKEI